MFYNYPLAYLHKLTKAVLGVGLFFLSIVAQAQAPAITSFAPSSGSVGSLITITGTNLSNPTSVSIGGVGAIIISNSSTSIVAMVMPGTVTSIITVTSTGGTVNSSSSFMVIASKPLDVQQGNKLVGTGAVGAANQGYSVSLSADGKTAIIGGEGDNSGEGAVWIYTRDNNGVWAQQGNKLVGMGAVGAAQQGYSVSLSANGNTAAVGGRIDNSSQGAVWIYTRDNNGVWVQQGNKLVGTGAVGAAAQGQSVSLSADGKTVIVGGHLDNNTEGAVWVYTCDNNGVWVQQGNKLVGTGAVFAAQQGYSASLNADGNTAIIGGFADNNARGAAWIFTRLNGVWTQQGNKLVGTGVAPGLAFQGMSVSISADGNTALVGGWMYNGGQGAAWLYTRDNNGVWVQQGNKLVGTGAVGNAHQGYSVSLSANGNTAAVGGRIDNSSQGAVWVYIASPAITVTGFLNGFTACGGSISPEQNFSVNGDGLTADMIITAPTGFEISRTNGGGFVNTITLSSIDGIITPTTIYVRIASTAVSTPGGNITISSIGAVTQNMSVSGALSPPGVFSYAWPSIFTKGQAIVNLAPTNSGCAVTNYSISPALPAGLNFNTNTGVISGTPTAISAATPYIITASNTGGSTTTAIIIQVVNNEPPPVITAFSPIRAKPGDLVNITGTGFSTTPQNNVVYFGATKATVVIASATSLVVQVPVGASYAPIGLVQTGTGLACHSLQLFNPIYSPAKSNITSVDFAPKQDFTTGDVPRSVVMGDIDGDGKPDMVYANYQSNSIAIARNTSVRGSINSNSFGTPVNLTPQVIGFNPLAVALGDIDGDGKQDLVFTDDNNNNVYIAKNLAANGSITGSSFGTIQTFSIPGIGGALGIADIDGDGRLDIAVADITGNTVSVIRNISTRGGTPIINFGQAISFPTASLPKSIAIGDIDGDGMPDLALVGFRNTGPGSVVSVLRNTSSFGSTPTISFATHVEFATGLSPNAVAIVDLDGDGKLDMVTANSGDGNISIFRNAATSGTIDANSFATALNSYTTEPAPQNVAFGDLDGDGKPDLAVSSGGANKISLFRNSTTNSGIAFDPKIDLGAGNTPMSLVIGDVDGDAKPDIITTNNNGQHISIFQNLSFVTVNASLTAFTGCAGTASGEQSFIVRGAVLSDNITLTAPTGFELSTTSGSGFGNSITLVPSSGTVAATTIYVRMAAAAIGTPSGNITVASTGAITQNIAVSGTVNAVSTIGLGTINAVATTATSFNIPYTGTTGSPNQYSVVAVNPSLMPSFTAVTNASLGNSPVTVPIPASAANSYTFTLIVRNSTTGCSGTQSFTVTVLAPPSGLSYPTPNVYTRNTPITNLNPTVTGSVVSYSVSPALPANLALNTNTGVISGTPTVISAQTTYTVTATNSVGSTNTGVSIKVNDVPPIGLSYPSPNIFTRSTPINSLSPTVSGGTVTSYTVSPNLPSGLMIDPVTGIISGTPSAVSVPATYTVTATNSGGSASTGISIRVNDIAPSGLSYPTPNVFTRNTTINSLSPTVTGTVVSYSISPALPSGLIIDAVTGIISGTPIASLAPTPYIITVSNSGGSASAAILITINEPAPSGLIYPPPNVFTRNTTINSLSPTVTGTVNSYSISPSLPTGLIFNTGTGVISGTPTVVSAQTSYTVTATNSGGSANTSVSITVSDIAPSGLSYPTPNVFTRNTTINSLSPTVTGTVNSYSISPSLPTGLIFNTGTGVISGTPTAVATQASYTITASNSGGSTNTSVSITVSDIAPRGLSYPTPNVFTRNTTINSLSPTVTGAVNSYSISPSLPSGLSLNTSTGVISGTPTVVSVQTSYTVTASNSSGNTSAVLTITVNDIAPSTLSYTSPNVFIRGIPITNLSPNVTGTVVGYSISPSLPAGLSLNASTGIISGTPIASLAPTPYIITASNSGGSASAAILITINEPAPSGLSYPTPNVFTRNTTINSLSPTVTGTVTSYSISPSLPAGLIFNTNTGVISGTPTLATAQAIYTITASNSGGNATAGISISVVDNMPPSGLSYTTPNVFTRGVPISSLNPTITGNVVSYSISPALPAGMVLNPNTGVISGTPTTVVAQASYIVTAMNSGGSTTAIVSITVNDIAPSGLSYTTPNVYTRGTAISSLSPTVTGNVVSYSVNPALPAGMVLNTNTGVISGTPTTVVAQANYVVTATNSGGSVTATISIRVNDLAPTGLSYSTPNVFTRNTAIGQLLPTAGGGQITNYTISPALPLGLQIDNSTGIIFGTPLVVSAPINYTVTAANTGGSTTANINIAVNDLAPFNLRYTENNVYTINTSTVNLVPTISGGIVITYAIQPSLPPGLVLNPNSGVISGKPTALSAPTNYTVTATNSGGSVSTNLSITVNDLAPSGLSYPTPNTYTRGLPINGLTPAVTGAVLTYSISPALPAGLSLNTSTGVISGTPSVIAAATNYTVTAINSGGSVSTNLSITLNDLAPTSLSYPTNNVFTRNTAIANLLPSITGGAAVSYSINPALPLGLSINTATGIIFGTPLVVSPTTTYTITATNSGGSVQAGCTITVNDIGLNNLIYTAQNVFTKGTAISQLVPIISGGVVVSFSISPALPAGLSLNTNTGVISGVPTVISAQTNYTVTAMNSGGSTTAGFSITVNDVAPFNLQYTPASQTIRRGNAIVAMVPTSSGGQVVLYSIQPSLPTGLSLNSNTGVINGIPSVTSPLTNYTVTATNSGGSANATLSIAVNDTTTSLVPILFDNIAVRIYPNPVISLTTVDLGKEPIQTVSIQLTDGTGNMIRKWVSKTRLTQLSLDGIVAGVYWLRIVLGTKSVVLPMIKS